jgi:hypothetical protein
MASGDTFQVNRDLLLYLVIHSHRESPNTGIVSFHELASMSCCHFLAFYQAGRRVFEVWVKGVSLGPVDITAAAGGQDVRYTLTMSVTADDSSVTADDATGQRDLEAQCFRH